MLKVESVSYEIKKRSLVKGITFTLRKGELLAITGANGAGKSTLISLLNGERTPSSGKITFNGKSLSDYKPEELAIQRATLSQHNAVNMAFPVNEIVMMGRYPHYRGEPKLTDQVIVAEAMEICGITFLSDRSYLTLSGGEQQRVQLARVLAQLWDQPGSLLLLDEPVAGLDLLYQQQTLAIAKALSRQGFMVVAVLHELNLAAQYADRILMLKNGRRWKDGSPAQVLTTIDIYTVFGMETEVHMNPKTLTPYIIPKEIKLNATHFNSILPSNVNNLSLKERYQDHKEQHPQKNIREMAFDLNVSEAELLMTGLGEHVIMLRPEMDKILQEVETLGRVLAYTANDHCVHERKGTYLNFSETPHATLFVGEDIDLRLFLQHWKLAFAVDDNGRRSLQFFDGQGSAIHKIYLTDESEYLAYDALVDNYIADLQQEIVIEKQVARRRPEKPDQDIDVQGFQNAWESMKDTHEFFGLLHRFGVSRLQALRLAPAGRATSLPLGTFKAVVSSCEKTDTPVMIFVANKACVQIHTGPVKNLIDAGRWYNIVDPEFNLQLKEDAIAAVWHVVKPSEDGDINSLELFDASGELILQLFGKRKPGIPELTGWREALQKNNYAHI